MKIETAKRSRTKISVSVVWMFPNGEHKMGTHVQLRKIVVKGNLSGFISDEGKSVWVH